MSSKIFKDFLKKRNKEIYEERKKGKRIKEIMEQFKLSKPQIIFIIRKQDKLHK